MLTRVASFMTRPGHDESGWFIKAPGPELDACRDSFYGYQNDHYNQKGFELMAARCVANLERILFENLPPVLEEELIRPLR